ncbi:MAG: 5-oxoprolinase subunit PxpA [Phycisphaerales bacterium JB060]
MDNASLLGPAIDLNADAGERDSLLESDLELLGLVSSVNIACGGHAGSVELMRAMVNRAAYAGVAIGAHPSYCDVEGFGRRELGDDPDAIYALCREQVGRLARVAAEVGMSLVHAKPHGALYHRAMMDPDAAGAVARGCLDAVAEVSGDPFASLVFFGLPDSAGLKRWAEMDLPVRREGFADRAYSADGLMLPRGEAGAVLEDASAAAIQALELARSGRFDTLCVHGDTPGALSLAGAVRGTLLGGGIRIEPG